MKTPLLRQPVKFFSFLLATVLLATSCSKSKDNNNDSGFPRTVSVEYKVTSSTGINKADISFSNETLGITDINNTNVPFSKKLDINLKEPVGVTLTGYAGVGGNLRLEILVNGKSVEAQDFNSNSSISSIISYAFVR